MDLHNKNTTAKQMPQLTCATRLKCGLLKVASLCHPHCCGHVWYFAMLACASSSTLMLPYLPFCSSAGLLLQTAGFSGMPAPPVRIPSKPPSIQQAPTGGTPMGTPPSARGIAAQLPFVDGSPDGGLSHSICSSLLLLHASTEFLVDSNQGELFVCCTTAACSQAVLATFAAPGNTRPSRIGLQRSGLVMKISCACRHRLPAYHYTLPRDHCHQQRHISLGFRQPSGIRLRSYPCRTHPVSDSPLHSKALQCLQANYAISNAQGCLAHQSHQGLPSLMPLTAPCPAMHLALHSMRSGMYSISSPGRRH